MDINIRLLIDLLTVVLGLSAAYYMWHSSVGGKIGQALVVALIGVIFLTFNHLADTVWYSKILDKSIIGTVHRAINLVGFVLLAFGYYLVSKAAGSQQKNQD